MNQVVSYELQQTEKPIAIVKLNNGKVNVLGHQAFAELNNALDQAEKDKAVVIITTDNPKVFSAGYDLKEMEKGRDAQRELVMKGSTFSKRLLSFPLPVIIACPGHAIAKGAFLLLSVDYRIGTQGAFKIGLNEIAIGMTMHHVGIALARHRVAHHIFNRAVMNAEMFSPEGAVSAGFLDEAVASEQLLVRALAKAEELAALDLLGHGQTKVRARKDYLEHLDWAIKEDASGSLFND